MIIALFDLLFRRRLIMDKREIESVFYSGEEGFKLSK